MLKINAYLANEKEGENFSFEIKSQKEEIQVNEEPFHWDLLEIKENSFHILHQNQSYKVEVLKADFQEKTFLIQVNGSVYELNAQNQFDLLLQQLGMDKINKAKVNELKAPMPGLLLEIKVAEGQEVKKGEILLILEAMKMENVLKAPADAKIKSIKVKKGENVEKNQLLLQFE